MRAVVLDTYGGPEVLQIREVPDLQPGVEQVRVQVAATALNRADVAQRMGRYPQPGEKPTYEIPGLEFAGVIDGLGPGATGWKVGDRVCGLLAGGGYAEQVVTHERMLMPIPDGLSFEEGAAMPEVFLTAYDALIERGQLGIGGVALIHAGGSGVGTAAIQLAKIAGARVIVTVGTDEKARRATELGADRAVLYKSENFRDVVLAETGGRGADVIIDFIGGPYLVQNLEAASVEGRIVVLATLGGGQGAFPLGLMMAKRIHLMGATLRARPLELKAGLNQRFLRAALPLFATGRLKPVVDRVYAFAEIAEAHRYMEENRNFGKIVVRVT